MPRASSRELRDEARRLYIENASTMTVQEIATKLGLPYSTVASWKQRDKWNQALKESGNPGPMSPSDRMKGKRNAAKPHPSQKGNQNGLKHGLYAKIKYETMTEDEKQLISDITGQTDSLAMQQKLIAELEVRERRMYQRIEDLQKKLHDQETDPDGLMVVGSVASSTTFTDKNRKNNGGKVNAQKTKRLIMDEIQSVEAALSVVQGQKQKAIATLHAIVKDRQMMEIEKERMELQRIRVDLERRRLALIDPDEDTDVLKEARELLGGIESAF